MSDKKENDAGKHLALIKEVSRKDYLSSICPDDSELVLQDFLQGCKLCGVDLPETLLIQIVRQFTNQNNLHTKNPVNSSCKEVCEKNTHVSQKKLHPNTEQYFSRYSQDDFFHNWLNPSFQTRKPLSEQDVSDLLFQRDKRKDWF